MTNRYTDTEWATFIEDTATNLDLSLEPYPCPAIGSPAFMQTIDHTLLKLEARAAQFDDLCAEARVDGFAVRGLSRAVAFIAKLCNRLYVSDHNLSTNVR